MVAAAAIPDVETAIAAPDNTAATVRANPDFMSANLLAWKSNEHFKPYQPESVGTRCNPPIPWRDSTTPGVGGVGGALGCSGGASPVRRCDKYRDERSGRHRVVRPSTTHPIPVPRSSRGRPSAA